MESFSKRQLEIIESAGKILSRSGLSGLTIKNLAKEMQFSESAIYRHFKCKEDIIIAMLQYLASNMDDRLSLLDKSTAPDERLKSMLKSQFEFFDKHQHFVVAVFSDCLMDESKQINHIILEIMSVKMKHLKPIISDGQKKGIFINQPSTDDLTHIIIGSFRLLMFKWRADNFSFNLKQKGNQLIKSIIKILIK